MKKIKQFLTLHAFLQTDKWPFFFNKSEDFDGCFFYSDQYDCIESFFQDISKELEIKIIEIDGVFFACEKNSDTRPLLFYPYKNYDPISNDLRIAPFWEKRVKSSQAYKDLCENLTKLYRESIEEKISLMLQEVSELQNELEE